MIHTTTTIEHAARQKWKGKPTSSAQPENEGTPQNCTEESSVMTQLLFFYLRVAMLDQYGQFGMDEGSPEENL